MDHDRVRPDLGAVADRDRAEQLRARADRDVVLDGRVALAGFEARPAQRDALEQGHAIADLGRLAHHDPGAVVDEEVAPDAGGGMDLDPGHDAARVRQQTGHERHVRLVQRVRDPVGEDRVHARVGEQDLRRSGRARGRVAVAGRRDILAQLARHACDRGQASQAVAPSATSEAAASDLERLLRRPQTVERAAPVRDHERHAGGAARLLERDAAACSPPRRRVRAGSRRRSPPRRRPDSSRPGCPYSARRASRPPRRRGWTPRRACREATARRGPRGRRFRRRRHRRTRLRSRPDGRLRPTREPGAQHDRACPLQALLCLDADALDLLGVALALGLGQLGGHAPKGRGRSTPAFEARCAVRAQARSAARCRPRPRLGRAS